MNNPINREITPDEVTDVVLSFNDPTLIANIFRRMGWSPSLEIVETLKMAKQDNNLSVKLRAIKHLRELIKEAAESSGLVANISQTQPLPGGGSTTFHAKRIIQAMNPPKRIESNTIGEDKNDEREEPNRESDRQKSRESSAGENDNRGDSTGGQIEESSGGEFGEKNIYSEGGDNSLGGRADPAGDDGVGETPAEDDGTGGGRIPGFPDDGETEDTPCSKTRKPDCDHDLFPGISGASANG